jgi:hypothetical protein
MEPENDIHFRNELLKLKLQAEHGVQFLGQVGEGEVPPELMHDFLAQVEAFENGLQNASYTTIGAFLGNPVWKPESEIADDQIGAALEELHAQLAQKDIRLGVLYPTDDRVIYRFITEELIAHEIEDVHVPGMTSSFIYEEFHPNHREEVRKRSREFIAYFFIHKIEEFPSIYMTSEMGAELSWQHFREAFDRFSQVKCKATEIWIDGGEALVTFDMSFTGHLKGEPEGINFAGTAKLALEGDENGWWQIARFELPKQLD